jgi:protein-S-isoprenylcysteine O-methyltransferase Ste14
MDDGGVRGAMVAEGDPRSIRPFAWRGIAYLIVFLPVALGCIPWAFFAAWERFGPDGSGVVRFGPFWMGICSALGVTVFAIGFTAYLYCSIWLMYYGRGPHVEFDPPTRLVVSGPYRWVRNPVAAAVIVMIVGEAIYFRSPGIVVLSVLLAPLAHYQVKRVEEPRLRLRFGDEYVGYCHAVPRWIPRWNQGRG